MICESRASGTKQSHEWDLICERSEAIPKIDTRMNEFRFIDLDVGISRRLSCDV